MNRSMVFNVPIYNMAKLRKKLATLNKKGKRAGTGELNLIEVSQTTDTQPDGTVLIKKQVVVEGEPPRIAGWTFLARLDHNTDPTGASNLVYVMPGQTIPAEMRGLAANCEHCGWQRRRRDTYILREDATGDLKQVGRTCIQEFIGLDPEKVLAHAERLRKLYDNVRDAESEPLDPSAMADFRNVDLETFLAFVAREIRLNGWRSSKEAFNNGGKSTKAVVWDTMSPVGGMSTVQRNLLLKKEDWETARAAIRWAKHQDKGRNDFTHNLVTIAEAGYIDHKAAGTAAYIVEGYRRDVQKKTTPQRDLSGSKHFVEVGTRFDTDVEIIFKRPVNGFNWTSTLVQMLTPEGNLIINFDYNGKLDLDVGTKLRIRATAKKCDEFKGVKQTVVNRVQVQ